MAIHPLENEYLLEIKLNKHELFDNVFINVGFPVSRHSVLEMMKSTDEILRCLQELDNIVIRCNCKKNESPGNRAFQ